MTNNQVCNVIGMIGCIIASVCFVLCFFGASAWVGAVIGITLMVISQANYD